tara:strand:+ start:11224 stop:11571 length:348 start_codon:yes stop_codon:yes gene_type:complete
MENKQFTKIGTYCTKCNQIVCKCNEWQTMKKEPLEFLGINFIKKDGSSEFVEAHEDVKKWAENILNETKYYIAYSEDNVKETDEHTFNEGCLLEVLVCGRCKVKTEDFKQTLILY